VDGIGTARGAPAEPGVRGIVDEAGFEAAFREHFASVYRFIARRVGPDLADDLAAETFASAYRRRASYRTGGAPVRAWFFGIAANLLRNHWRAEQRLLERDAKLAVTTSLTSPAADAGDTDLEPRVAVALARLNRDQREVLLLHAWADLDHDEIAAALHIPLGTVRSRLSRARASLRAELGHPADEEEHAKKTKRDGHA
jgi:RNA polymerase sigma-70 factor (ECF subfamily)